METAFTQSNTRPAAAWGAVLSMALCVAVLIASEFMPVSLLSPIAADLGTTEGQTGQAISISGLFAVLTSLFVTRVIQNMDRRIVLMSFSLMLIFSGAIVSLAPNYAILMAGRALLGVAIGGFWSMSTAIIMRLVPQDSVPKALAILNGATAIAATVSAPLGSMLGDYIGWRGAFFLVVPLALVALVWQWVRLPSLPPRPGEGSSNLVQLMALRHVAFMMASVMLLFMGQFALFTYLRPFLERVTGVTVPVLSSMLLVMGLAGIVGTYSVSRMLRTRLFSIIAAIPLVMALIAVLLIAFGGSAAIVWLLLAAWGFFGSAAPVGWGTWLSRYLPNDAEVGGGLLVAVIQLAITIGAAFGGLLFDLTGWQATFAFAAASLCGSSALAVAAWSSRHHQLPPGHG